METPGHEEGTENVCAASPCCHGLVWPRCWGRSRAEVGEVGVAAVGEVGVAAVGEVGVAAVGEVGVPAVLGEIGVGAVVGEILGAAIEETGVKAEIVVGSAEELEKEEEKKQFVTV